MPVSGTRGPVIDGNASSRPALYGCRGESNTSRVGPNSATWPAYITISRSEKWLTSDMSWVNDQVRGEQHGHRDNGPLPHPAGQLMGVAVVADEARLLARVLCTVVTIVDPELIVLGGGIGQAPGFADAVTGELRLLAPVVPEVRVSALGAEAVVDGCLAAAAELAWAQLTVALPAAAGPEGDGSASQLH